MIKTHTFAILNEVRKNLSRLLFAYTRSCGGGPLAKLLTASDVKSAPITFSVRTTKCHVSCWCVVSMEGTGSTLRVYKVGKYMEKKLRMIFLPGPYLYSAVFDRCSMLRKIFLPGPYLCSTVFDSCSVLRNWS